MRLNALSQESFGVFLRSKSKKICIGTRFNFPRRRRWKKYLEEEGYELNMAQDVRNQRAINIAKKQYLAAPCNSSLYQQLDTTTAAAEERVGVGILLVSLISIQDLCARTSRYISAGHVPVSITRQLSKETSSRVVKYNEDFHYNTVKKKEYKSKGREIVT